MDIKPPGKVIGRCATCEMPMVEGTTLGDGKRHRSCDTANKWMTDLYHDLVADMPPDRRLRAAVADEIADAARSLTS